MTDRVVIRGDDYVIREQVFALTIVDKHLEPFDMHQCTIRSTFKFETVPHDLDPDDSSASLKCFIAFDGAGAVTASDGLQLPTGGTAAEGVLWLTADRAATLALPLGTPLVSDVEIVDANGEHATIMSVWTLTAVDAVTNRTVD